MADLPEARIAHFSTGRLRVKIPDRRGDEAFFNAIEQRLAGWETIEHIETNPLTGSVLVQFSDPAALFAENALKNDLFSVSFDELLAAGNDEPAPKLTEWAARRVGDADQAMRRWTGGTADIHTVVFLFLVTSGIVQVLRRNISAPATTMLWYAGAMLRLWDVVPELKQALNEG